MQEPSQQRPSLSKYIQFLGGWNTLFTLTVFILLAVLIFMYTQISYIFNPFFVFLSSVSLPVILAGIFFYPLNNIVNLLEKHLKLKRIWGTTLVFILLITIITSLIAFLVPMINQQINSLVVNFPVIIDSINERLATFMQNSWFKENYQTALTWLNDNLTSIPQQLISSFGTAFSGIGTIISHVSSIGVALLTAIIVLFFMLVDGKKFHTKLLTIIPPRYRRDVDGMINDMNAQVGAYIQGQMAIALVTGIITFIGYSFINVDYALALASIAGFANFIPYIGSLLGATPALIVAIFTSPDMFTKMLILWILVQIVVGNIIAPSILGKNLQIHPLTVIFVLLLSGNMAGMTGVILGIPAYAILRIIVFYLFTVFKRRYNKYYAKNNELYELEQPAEVVQSTPANQTITQKLYNVFFINKD